MTIPGEALVLQLLNRSIEQNEQILKKLALAEQKLDQHMSEEERIIKALVAAFPKKLDGSPDYEGHNAYHTTLIMESIDRAKMFRELRADLIKKSVWGVFIVLGVLIAYWWNGHVPPKP